MSKAPRNVLTQIRKCSHVSGLNLNEYKSTILQVGKNQLLERQLENIKIRKKTSTWVHINLRFLSGKLKNSWEIQLTILKGLLARSPKLDVIEKKKLNS